MADNEWSRPAQPPPPLFFNKKERDLVKQVNDELVERVIGQTVVYYPLSLEHTNYHPLYGEAIEKTFLSTGDDFLKFLYHRDGLANADAILNNWGNYLCSLIS